MEALIHQSYKHYCGTPSDIHEHLPTLFALASEVKHVTEMGTRAVVSTWALLMGRPEVLRCYDIHRNEAIEQALMAAESAKIDMKFIEADVLDVTIEETDMLFIDTLHIYSQLKRELAMHAGKVRKYIVFHDVVTYGHRPEPASWQTPEIMKNYKQNDGGIMPAIEEFLAENPQWKAKKLYENNNGLLVIERHA